MGSWDETCALTHTGIREGDPVVLVRITLDEGGTRRVGSLTDTHLEWFFLLLPHVISIETGNYNDYGDIEGGGPESTIKLFFHEDAWLAAVEFITKRHERERRGKYPPGFDYTIDHLCGAGGPLTDRLWLLKRLLANAEIEAAFDPTQQPKCDAARKALDDEVAKIPPRLPEFWKVCRLAANARQHILPPPSGPQFREDSLPDQRFLHTLTGEILKAQSKKR